MNPYITSSQYFLIFIFIATLSYAAVPHVHTAMKNLSDTYIRGQMNKVQGEILFMNTTRQTFHNVCHTGLVHTILTDLVNGYTRYTSCRTNRPEYSEIMVCAYLKSGNYFCIDGVGVRCELAFEPNHYRCKAFSQGH